MTTTTMPERVRKLVQALNVDFNILAEGYAKYRLLLDGGFIDTRTMYSLIWADNDITLDKEVEDKIVAEDLASFTYRNESTLAYMRSLKSQGYKIGILTNMSLEFAKMFRQYFPDFIELADAMVISGEERMFKPQRRIYDLLQKRIALKGEEILFIDDVEKNCEGARKAGWRAYRYLREQPL